MRYHYITHGTCSVSIDFDLSEDGTVSNVSFERGCNGNLKGISAFAEGMKAEDIIKKVDGIKCGFKNTSCPDQLAQALKSALKEKGNA